MEFGLNMVRNGSWEISIKFMINEDIKKKSLERRRRERKRIEKYDEMYDTKIECFDWYCRE
jgi:hypothetical protein